VYRTQFSRRQGCLQAQEGQGREEAESASAPIWLPCEEARRAKLSEEYAAEVAAMKAEAAERKGGRPKKDEKPTDIVPSV
jgi:hypothetical protein